MLEPYETGCRLESGSSSEPEQRSENQGESQQGGRGKDQGLEITNGSAFLRQPQMAAPLIPEGAGEARAAAHDQSRSGDSLGRADAHSFPMQNAGKAGSAPSKHFDRTKAIEAPS